MIAQRVLACLLALFATLAVGYWWGRTATDQAWTTRTLRQQVQAADAWEKQRQRADAAAGAYLREHLDQEARYETLEQRYAALRHHAPLVVAPTCRTDPGQPAGTLPEDLVPGPQDSSPPASPGLTWAAVRVWNGALIGTDAPAGACGLADTTEQPDPACALGSGLTLDDAWRNHALNARSCAADRARYQRLIDYLNGK